MSEAALALQSAVVAALKAAGAVCDLVGDRVYDAAPAEARHPYVVVDGWDALPDRGDCYDGVNIAFAVHVWSRAVGFPETHRVSAAITTTLHGAALMVGGFRLVDLSQQRTMALRDPDGKTLHGVVSFEAMLEPT